MFCFTPKGQLISLPRGATPVDFAYAVHSQVGDTCVGAKINGRLLPLRTELQNGDGVEIMTARGGTPSPGLGALRRHRQGAGAHPPLRRPAAAPDPYRPGPAPPWPRRSARTAWTGPRRCWKPR
ncbi:MAG: TGS domain-containing protein [Acetobacteraceae bacterium]